MSVMELFEQAKTLAPYEKRELATLLINSIEEVPPTPPATGAEIVALLMAMEPLEFVDPDITDPVEWVNAQRQKDADRLKPYWNGEK